MAIRRKISASIGPVRALALKHVPALVILQRHVDADWSEMEAVSEQMVAGFYYPEEVDPIEKEIETKDETPKFDTNVLFNTNETQSRRRGIEENERWEVDGGDLPHL